MLNYWNQKPDRQMENNKYVNASLDDIVFEGRNREYGAYIIRKIYSKHVTRGLIIACLLFVSILAFPVIRNKFFPKEKVVVEEKIVDVNTLENPPPLDEETPPPPPPPPAEPPPPPPVAATIKFTPPVVKKDEQVKKEEVPDQEEMKDVEISTKTQEGVKGAPPDLSDLDKGNAETAGAVEEIFQFVEQRPEFPGGEAAMQKFLAENIRYPSVAQRNGLEGLVVLAFVVNRKGEISDIQVLKKLGGGTEEEAIRVVKSMPKWKPGRNNGREVSVRYNLPVRFKMQ